MVTNDEISQRLRNKREGKSLNGYLVCNNCEGYYELQPGESANDFSADCECGGTLINSPTNTLYPPEYEDKEYSSLILFSYIAIIFIGPLVFLLGLYLLTRDNERAKFHGKILILIALAYLVIIILAGLLIYMSYFSSSNVNQIPDDLNTVRSTRLFFTCFLNL